MERTGHSVAGILSFAAALLSLVCLGVFFFSVLDTMRRLGPEATDSQEAMAWIGLLMLGLVGGALLGLILGVVGLVQQRRSRLFAGVGLGISGVLLTVTAFLMLIGYLVK